MMVNDSKLLVVALGGNAITAPGAPPDIPNQFKTTARTAQSLADLVEAGHHVVITHGNGPQVGKVLRRVEMSVPEVYPLPLEICVADTQAGMGYMIAQCLTNEFEQRGHPRSEFDRRRSRLDPLRGRRRTVTCVVTTVCVDRDDPAFANPTKPIGSFYTEQQAEKLQREDGWTMAEVLKGQYRRVVPSPVPMQILETDSIRQLVHAGQLIIACGGGGIPVICNEQGHYQGVAAVIDKDLTSALLATKIDADGMIILTSIEKVCLNFQKPDQLELDCLTLDQAKRYQAQGHFPPGSMGPKIEASVQFLENSNKPDCYVLITSPERIIQGLQGKTGTKIIQGSRSED